MEATTAYPITVRQYDYLFRSDEGIEESGMNPDSVMVTTAMGEPGLAEASPGQRFQFFRHGYYIADHQLTNEDDKVFNLIVDLKSSFKVNK